MYSPTFTLRKSLSYAMKDIDCWQINNYDKKLWKQILNFSMQLVTFYNKKKLLNS